jgi:hypothetical protein
MFAVLDAVIQMHGTVTPEAISSLAKDFTAQALTLFGTMPEPQRTELAMSIYAARDGEYAEQQKSQERANSDPFIRSLKAGGMAPFDRWTGSEPKVAGGLVRMAAAILANNPPPGFAASLMNELTTQLELSIGADDPRADFHLGPMCGDSLGTKTPDGWPKKWAYVVEQYWPTEMLNGVKVIVPGVPAITTRRAETSSSCSAIGGLSSSVRIQLLTQMLGLENGKLGWTLQAYEQVPYSNDLDFQRSVQTAVAQREQAYRATAAALAAKGWMTAEEARGAEPTLELWVRDARESKVPPIPQVPLIWNNVSLTDGQ